jgi:hypothetical protein
MQFSLDYSVSSLADFYTGTAIKAAPKHTGRLPLSGDQEKNSVPAVMIYSNEPGLLPTSTIMERINYRHSCTPLNTTFFSQANVDNLQSKIKADVLARSMGRHVIDNQSESDLLIIMRSYYLQYGDNSPDRVAESLEDLNQRVVSYCGNTIMSEVEAYKHYRKDIMDFPAPIERPVMTNIYGTRTGELKSFF